MTYVIYNETDVLVDRFSAGSLKQEGRHMAQIPDHEIERLKKGISVERLAEARGIQVTRHGANVDDFVSTGVTLVSPWRHGSTF